MFGSASTFSKRTPRSTRALTPAPPQKPMLAAHIERATAATRGLASPVAVTLQRCSIVAAVCGTRGSAPHSTRSAAALPAYRLSLCSDDDGDEPAAAAVSASSSAPAVRGGGTTRYPLRSGAGKPGARCGRRCRRVLACRYAICRPAQIVDVPSHYSQAPASGHRRRRRRRLCRRRRRGRRRACCGA